jgi:biotin transport system substrate-specific component
MRQLMLRKEIAINKTLARCAGICLFIFLTALGAFVRIPLPFSPVPITLQTFFVLLSGAMLGNLGVLSQIGYVLLGVVGGLPIFANAGYGIGYLCGPTGGYLAGFVLCAFFLSRALPHRYSFISIVIAMCIGDFIIFVCGLIWLKVAFGYPSVYLLTIGFFPFVPGDLAKILLASGIFFKLRSRLREIS